MSNGVAFRRIHGRVVPIKMSDEDKKKMGAAGKAAVAATATVAASAASGALYSKMTAAAGNMTAKNIMDFKPNRAKAAGILNISAFRMRQVNTTLGLKKVFDAGQYGMRGLEGFAKRQFTAKNAQKLAMAAKKFAK